MRSFGYRLILLAQILVIARHGQLHSLGLAQRSTQHEEGDKKHHHVHHRCEIHTGVHLFLLAFFFLCHD